MNIFESRLIFDMTIDVYLEADRISRGLLFDFSKEPSIAHVMLKDKKGDHYSMGRAIHTAVLEPHIFEKSFIRGPIDRRGKKWSDAKDRLTNRQELLTDGDYVKALQIRDSIWENNPRAKEIIENSIKEVTCFAEDDEGRKHKARADLLSMYSITDLKSTTSVDSDFFSKEIFKHGYHVQAAYYLDVFGNNYPSLSRGTFDFIAVEKEPPYISNVFTLDKAAILLGRETYEKGLALYDSFVQNNKIITWPEPQTIDIPAWAYPRN